MSNKVISIFGDKDPREVPLYTVRQAAGYLGVPASTMRAWMLGQNYLASQKRTGRFEQLIEIPAGIPARLTFNNLIEAYVLATLRRVHAVDLSAVRRAIDNVRRTSNHPRPLLSCEFATDGVRLYLEETSGEILDVSTADGGQYVIPAVVRLGLQRIERREGLITKLYPFRDDVTEPRIVSIDPTLSFGRPTIDGTGVAVAVVADFVKAGESVERVAREFGISKSAVSSAVQWHTRAAA